MENLPCTYSEDLYYLDEKGDRKTIKSGRKLTLIRVTDRGNAVLRWGNKMFFGDLDKIIFDK